MPVHTHVHDADARIESEREAVQEKLDAIDRFIDRVDDCSPARTPSSATGVTATVGALVRGGKRRDDQCEAVRRAFAETIRPHSLDDVEERESLQETIAAELSEQVARALAPTTETALSPELKRTVRSQATARRAETDALRRALDREAAQVADARAVVEEVTEWLAAADETPLRDLGFEALRDRHETLADHRSACRDLAERRQAFLQGATNSGAGAGISHEDMVPYVYQDFPVEHPVLATVARLDDTCAQCQRAVRDHLVRRA